VVLKDCVTEINVTLCSSNTSTSREKIHQRARQPVDLVNHDDIDLAGLDVREQALQRGAVEGAA
jgi:hypothetical protein